MEGSHLEKINYFCRELLDFLLLNLSWIGCTLLGLFVLGWAPSTVALFTVLRDKIMKNEKGGVVSVFWKTYKSEFKKSNIIGVVIVFFAFVIYVNRSNFMVQEGQIFAVLYMLSTIAKWVLLAVTLYIFPMYVHYSTDILNYFSKSLTIIILKPIMAVCVALWCWIMYSLFITIPGIFPVIGISLFAYGIMAINYQLFMRNDKKLKANEN